MDKRYEAPKMVELANTELGSVYAMLDSARPVFNSGEVPNPTKTGCVNGPFPYL